MKEEKEIKCSFCGRPYTAIERIIPGKNAYICEDCIKLAHDILKEEKKKENLISIKKIPNPEEIKKKS